MKQKLIFFILLLATFQWAQAQTFTNKSTILKVSGDSNVHKWDMTAQKAQFSTQFDLENGELKGIKSAILKINIKDLKSNKEGMDARAYKSLNADTHPVITYELVKTKSITKKENDYVAILEGKLTLNGVSKNTTMQVTLSPLANGDFKAKGSDKILFTNHRLKAPSYVAGTMRVDNEVVVSFDLTLKK